MNLKARLLPLMLWLTIAVPGSAMPIDKYDRMTVNDQSSYDALLMVGAKNALMAHGDTDQANKLIALFKETDANGGSAQLMKNLERVRSLNREILREPKHTQPLYEVEHAFYLTLKENGIVVPLNVLLGINKDFKPSSSNDVGQ